MSQIPLPQGAVKLSEVFTDNAQAMLGSAVGQDAQQVFEQLRLVVGDAIRKNAYIFFSEGNLNWQQDTLSFNNGSVVNNMVLRLLQTENGFPRTIDLRMNGSITGNGTNKFQSITLNDGDLLYLELDRAQLAASGGTLVIENAVNGGSLVTGRTLKKIALSSLTGMPEIASPIGGATQTCYIPIAMRVNYGVNNKSSIYWIPHGIQWPSDFNGTTSTWSIISSFLGGVIVSGVEALPDYFVSSQSELITAAAILAPTGGRICIKQSFTMDSVVALGQNVKVIGKSWGRATLTILPGGGFTMAKRSEIRDVAILGAASLNSGTIISIGAGVQRAEVNDCKFTFQNTSGLVSGIAVSGNETRVTGCEFVGTEDITNGGFRLGIDYVAGTNNSDSDCIWT